MGPLSRQASDRGIKSIEWKSGQFIGLTALILFLVSGGANCVWALQRNELSSNGIQNSGQAHGVALTQSTTGQGGSPGSATSDRVAQGIGQQPPSQAVPHAQGLPEVAAPPGVGPDEHKAAEHGGAAHGPSLPEISTTPGVTFVDTMVELMDYELNGRFLGWRPNDLIIGRFTDNINSYQLGVLEAMRFTTLRLKDSLTRMGDADAYDSDLEHALNLFMNKSTLFWFPSAENSYDEAVEHLRKFRNKLEGGQRNFYYRVDNLISLINAYKDLLGNVNRSLIMATYADGSPIGWFDSDQYFYYAKGVSHVLYEILRVVRVGYKDQLATINAVAIMDEILHELHRVEGMDPWIVLDSDLDGFWANHRANINAPLSEVNHLLSVISRF